ncbi:hypothetical protein OK016_02675 [Vibrio chagasii]|nr:hypothetical protein [Vibrio chagasii]
MLLARRERFYKKAKAVLCLVLIHVASMDVAALSAFVTAAFLKR